MRQALAREHRVENKSSQQVLTEGWLLRAPDRRARVAHHHRKSHSGRACRLARATFEAEVHVFLEGRAVNRNAPFFHGLDEVDSPPGRIHFTSKLEVGGTDGKTDSA